MRRASFPGQSAWGRLDVLQSTCQVCQDLDFPPSVPGTEFVTTVATWRCASHSGMMLGNKSIQESVHQPKNITFRNDVLSRRERLMFFPTETIWICVGASKVRNICSVRGRKDKTCFTHFDRLTLRRIVSGTLRPWNI